MRKLYFILPFIALCTFFFSSCEKPCTENPDNFGWNVTLRNLDSPVDSLFIELRPYELKSRMYFIWKRGDQVLDESFINKFLSKSCDKDHNESARISLLNGKYLDVRFIPPRVGDSPETIRFYTRGPRNSVDSLDADTFIPYFGVNR